MAAISSRVGFCHANTQAVARERGGRRRAEGATAGLPRVKRTLYYGEILHEQVAARLRGERADALGDAQLHAAHQLRRRFLEDRATQVSGRDPRVQTTIRDGDPGSRRQLESKRETSAHRAPETDGSMWVGSGGSSRRTVATEHSGSITGGRGTHRFYNRWPWNIRSCNRWLCNTHSNRQTDTHLRSRRQTNNMRITNKILPSILPQCSFSYSSTYI